MSRFCKAVLNTGRIVNKSTCVVTRNFTSPSNIVWSRNNQIVNKEKVNIFTDLVSLTINGTNYKYPSVWLRDNCQCAKCFHKDSQSRVIDWKEFDVDIAPSKVQQDPNSVSIEWEDGHLSEFNYNWLLQRSFDLEQQNNYLHTVYKPFKQIWNAKTFTSILHKFDYEKLFKSDMHLHDWLHNMAVYGVTVIENTPSSEDSLRKLVNKVGFIRKTHYGEEFIVESKPNTSNVAYLSSNLQPHTDLPYYDYMPGVTLLHCVVQTKTDGGDNSLTDCHYIANHLKENYPDEYNLLSTILVDWTDIGKENNNAFYSINRSPVICEDSDGNIIRINHSIPQRGSHFTTHIKNVKPWYKALKLFVHLIYKNSTYFKMRPGEVLVFDNIRLVHGRRGYLDVENNTRRLVGAYLDWDEIYSRLRCLKQKKSI